MVAKTVVVAEPSGIHLRPAGKLCEVSSTFQSLIQMKKGDRIANAKSVLGVLAARVQCGDTVEILCDGPDEEEALAAIVQLMEEGFDLPPGSEG